MQGFSWDTQEARVIGPDLTYTNRNDFGVFTEDLQVSLPLREPGSLGTTQGKLRFVISITIWGCI